MTSRVVRIALFTLLALPQGQALSTNSINNSSKIEIDQREANVIQGELHMNIRSNANANANSGAGAVEADAEGNTKNKALKISPKDMVYDTHQIDDDEKFHAPSLAPNDKQPDASDNVINNQAVEEKTSEDSKKGSKGSVILDDYDPTRLGVSADEAHKAKSPANAAGKDATGKDATGKDTKSNEDVVGGVDSAGKKDVPKKETPKKKPTAADSARAVEENKAPVKPVASSNALNAQTQAKAEEVQKVEGEKQKAESEKQIEKQAEMSTPSRDRETAEAIAEAEKFKGHQYGRLVGSAMMIVVSEIGDKTFFIAALMAMRHQPWFVFSSSYSAMVIMTVLSMVLGLVLPSLLSRKVTTLLAALLFLFFGLKMVKEAWAMDGSLAATEELDEVEQDLAMSDRTLADEKAEAGGRMSDESPRNSISKGVSNLAQLVFSPVWIQIFVMTFLGEWGDRSQIATVAMGAGEGWGEVLTGCLFGHFVTTGIAVLGGKILAKQLSLRTVTIGGAACFLLFAIFYFNDWLKQ